MSREAAKRKKGPDDQTAMPPSPIKKSRTSTEEQTDRAIIAIAPGLVHSSLDLDWPINLRLRASTVSLSPSLADSGDDRSFGGPVDRQYGPINVSYEQAQNGTPLSPAISKTQIG